MHFFHVRVVFACYIRVMLFCVCLLIDMINNSDNFLSCKLFTIIRNNGTFKFIKRLVINSKSIVFQLCHSCVRIRMATPRTFFYLIHCSVVLVVYMLGRIKFLFYFGVIMCLIDYLLKVKMITWKNSRVVFKQSLFTVQYL